MPYKTKWLKKGIEWQFFGLVTGEDFLRANMLAYGDTRFDDLNFQIADFLMSEEINVTENDIKKVAYLDMVAAKTNPFLKVAFITDKQELKDYAHLFEAYILDIKWECSVFEERNMALGWLGLKSA